MKPYNDFLLLITIAILIVLLEIILRTLFAMWKFFSKVSDLVKKLNIWADNQIKQNKAHEKAISKSPSVDEVTHSLELGRKTENSDDHFRN